MVLDREEVQLSLLDILEFDDYETHYRVKERPFCALSLRYEGDTDILCGGETIHLTAGDILFFPPGLSYYRDSHRDRMTVFHLTVEGYRGDHPEVYRGMADETVRNGFAGALREWQMRQSGYRMRSTAYLYQIFGHLHRLRTEPTSAPRLSPMLEEVLCRMNQGLGDAALSVASLAAEVHVSESYLRRVFTASMGVSPKQYLTNLRMERALSLLNAGYDSVSSVAARVGYTDPKNFSTAFRRRFGYPPSRQSY